MTRRVQAISSPPPPTSAHTIVLPGAHDAANEASKRGQDRYVRFSAARFIALLIAAVVGAIPFQIAGVDASGLVLLLGFLAAAAAELALIYFQPERDWYSGRAIAESTKTLAWRFSVVGEPFGPDLTDAEAEDLLRTRFEEVLRRGGDRIDIGAGDAVVTPSMRAMRRESQEVRKQSYLECRTEDQRHWYSTNAKQNERRATMLRYALLCGELVAVVIAAVSFGRDEPADFAGIAAACVASGAAWLGLKQYSQLTSAYRVAATELALQAGALRDVSEDNWPQAVADAEEAISREHTMWLATRGEEPLA